MIEQKKPPVSAGGLKDNSFALSQRSGTVPDFHCSIQELNRNPHTWAPGNRARNTGGFVVNAHRPHAGRAEAGPNNWKSLGAQLPGFELPYLSTFWAAFSSRPLPSNAYSRSHFPRNAEAIRSALKPKPPEFTRRRGYNVARLRLPRTT